MRFNGFRSTAPWARYAHLLLQYSLHAPCLSRPAGCDAAKSCFNLKRYLSAFRSGAEYRAQSGSAHDSCSRCHELSSPSSLGRDQLYSRRHELSSPSSLGREQPCSRALVVTKSLTECAAPECARKHINERARCTQRFVTAAKTSTGLASLQ